VKTDEARTDAEERDEDEPQDGRALLRRALLWSLAVFLVLRVALSLLALAGIGLVPNIDNEVGVPGWPAPELSQGWHNLVTAWERFDALWFLRIGSDGYRLTDGSAAFFPLYPLTIRAVSPILGGHPLAAALLVTNLAAFGSLVLLYLLSTRELGEDVARRAVVYLAVFPTSFFLLAPYSESLFLFLVLACFLAARSGRWALAAIAGAAAGGTRSLGMLLVAPLAVEAFHQVRERRSTLARSLPWAIAPLVGTGAYLLFWQLRAGDWLAPIHYQANWQREFVLPWVTLGRGTIEAFRFLGTYAGGYHLLDWLIVVPALAGGVWVMVRTRPVYGVYALLSLLAPLSLVFVPRPFMSLPRFLLAVFPLLWVPAVWARKRRGVHEALIALSAGALGIMTILFVNWYYVF